MNITIFGCGGCGINQINKLVEDSKQLKPFGDRLDVVAVDTSTSNPVNKTITESYVLGNQEGSGKDRGTNSTELMQQAAQVVRGKLDSTDVFVFIASTSGGSGDVISNVMINTVLSAGKLAIKLCVAHTNSFKNTENTLKAFKTMEKVCGERYLGVMIYDNGGSRLNADMALQRDLLLLLNTLCVDYIELDDNDKRKFLAPHNVQGPHGIGFYDKMILGPLGEELPANNTDISMSDNQLVIPTTNHVPSVLTINETGDAESKFICYEDFVGISNDVTITAVNGVALSPYYLTYLRDTMTNHNRVVHVTTQMDNMQEDNLIDDMIEV